uniref:Uncharacterized protein n=1 Tax=Rhizophora mucronata TaxID=61149 RepID=A0A2P2PRA5_RHIMU
MYNQIEFGGLDIR